MTAPFPPIRRGPPGESRVVSVEDARRAVKIVGEALKFFTPGAPIVHRGPMIHVDVPVLYLDFAIDRIHYDVRVSQPSPKGNPAHSPDVRDINTEEIMRRTEEVLAESRVLRACEFREPEDCWIVPVAWKSFIIMHVRVSADGSELIPDYGLTEEVRRHGI